MRLLLIAHCLLMLLVSTSFTIVTSIFGGSSLRWCYYHYSSNSGFGQKYVSHFSELEIYAYIATFAVGIIGYVFAIRSGRRAVGTIGIIVSTIGLASFVNEIFQLAELQYMSWIAFSPILMFVIAVFAFLPIRQHVLMETIPREKMAKW